MTEFESGAFAGASANMVANLRLEFIGETCDRLHELEAQSGSEPDLAKLRRLAFEVKGQAHNFGMHLLEVVAQRFEDYLSAFSGAARPPEAAVSGFLARMTDLLEGTTSADEDAALVVRSLPARPSGFDVSEVEIQDVEVMLVMEHGAQARFVEREMHACGYRVSIVQSSFEAFEMAVRTRPDMIIVSAVMDGLSGIDLAIAFSAMPGLRNTPVALITSLDRDDERLRLLPQSVPVIRKSHAFGEDLANALEHHFLL